MILNEQTVATVKETFLSLDFLNLSNYEISNQGNIKSLARTLINKNGRVTHLKERILKPGMSSCGYLTLGLVRDDGAKKSYLLHRLVAMAHVDGDKTLQVDHVNGVKTDCRASNLRWVSGSVNTKDSFRHHHNANRTRKITLSKDGKVMFFNSQKEAASHIGVCTQAISYAAKNGVKCKGFTVIASAGKTKAVKRAIEAMDILGNVYRFESIAEAVRKTGSSRPGIHRCLQGQKETSNGYRWKYATEVQSQLRVA